MGKTENNNNFKSIWDTIVKEQLVVANEESETNYSEEVLHFANQIKSFLMTIDYQTDKSTSLQAINLALKSLFGEEIVVYKIINKRK